MVRLLNAAHRGRLIEGLLAEDAHARRTLPPRHAPDRLLDPYRYLARALATLKTPSMPFT